MFLIVFPPKRKHVNNIQPVVTLYKLHPESVPSDIVGILPTKVFGSSVHLH